MSQTGFIGDGMVAPLEPRRERVEKTCRRFTEPELVRTCFRGLTTGRAWPYRRKRRPRRMAAPKAAKASVPGSGTGEAEA